MVLSKVVIGVIGGSGVYQLENLKIVTEHDIDTPFGKTSDKIIEAELGGVTFFFLARHGKNHSISPSEVNYRANIFALKKLGANYIISVSAVGSLKTNCKPGTLFLPSQFIDWTKGIRARSFFGDGMVGHVSVARPINLELKKIISNCCEIKKIEFETGGSYICIEGPQFSTRAESEFYRSIGASVIGMTNVPEAFLAQEAGMAYATIAMVTDYDCWKDEHCTVTEILNVIKANYSQVNVVLPLILQEVTKNKPEIVYENEYALITNKKNLGERHQEILKVILEK